ncbi:hypothetical protein Tsubulata_013955 [Turnera subulata]|uniref:Disease resistance R13L4/SHOC-2-like LRR domain-containing protein n=1 Tax=Turnera subulata TaxID=218843 RepID=A0A9Q0GI51_9ROSI|nr:hypothetical protein Tsubulata_013955 [Turnera subulata]
MDPNSVKSTLSNLAFGNVMAAAARDYQKELLAQEKAQTSSSINQEVDLDELMDDPELEKLHADRIATLKDSRHLGINGYIDGKQLMNNRKLRALLSTTKTGELNKITSRVTGKLSECLRVLDLCKSAFEMPISSLLCQVGSLQHLTYLRLSNTDPLIELPSSLKKLNNLQILDVSYYQSLKSLPSYLISFKKLRVLDASHSGSLECFPKGLGRLSNLEVLLGFRLAKSSQSEGCRIAELKNLTRLRTLGLHFKRDDEIGDDEENALVKLQEL